MGYHNAKNKFNFNFNAEFWGNLLGGYFCRKLYGDVPARLWKFDFLYTKFLPNYPPISNTIID